MTFAYLIFIDLCLSIIFDLKECVSPIFLQLVHPSFCRNTIFVIPYVYTSIIMPHLP